MQFRGAFHAHSSFSYDGRDSLERIAGELRRRGFHFLLLTEHDDKLTAESFARVVASAEEHSGPDFLIIPGLEIRCWRRAREQWHIAALGLREWVPRGSITEVVTAIQAAGGLAIFLHPYKHSALLNPAELAIFDGIEIWNGKFDGFYAPQARTVRLFRALQRTGRPAFFYCGHDLHAIEGIAPLALEVESEALNVESIIAELRRGEFYLEAPGGRFSCQLGPDLWQSVYLHAMRAAYEGYRLGARLPLLGTALRKGRDTIRAVDPYDE